MSDLAFALCSVFLVIETSIIVVYGFVFFDLLKNKYYYK